MLNLLFTIVFLLTGVTFAENPSETVAPSVPPTSTSDSYSRDAIPMDEDSGTNVDRVEQDRRAMKRQIIKGRTARQLEEDQQGMGSKVDSRGTRIPDENATE